MVIGDSDEDGGLSIVAGDLGASCDWLCTFWLYSIDNFVLLSSACVCVCVCVFVYVCACTHVCVCLCGVYVGVWEDVHDACD